AWGLGGGAEVPASGRPARGDFTPRGRAREAGTFGRRQTLFVAVAYGLSGFIGVAYEVVWARYLSLFLVTSTYANSAMLTVFLTGLGLGSLLFGPLFDRRRNLLGAFGLLQLGIGVSVLAVAPALLALDAPAATTGQLVRVQFLLCAAMMIVPTTLMGAITPLASRIVVRDADRAAPVMGALYAGNVVGSIAGAFAASLGLVPALGIEGTLALLAALNGALGIAALALEPAAGRLRRAAAGAVVAAAAGTAAAFWSPAIPEARLERLVGPSETLVTVREGVTGTVWVSQDAWHRKALWVNTSVMGRTQAPGYLSAQRVQGHLPLLLHRGTPEVVCGIAFGTGQTFGAQLLHPIRRLDAVDISRTVVETAFEHFRGHLEGFPDDPRASVIVEDGRRYLARTGTSYDVITLEMPPQMEAGIVHFYTREFYDLVRRRLNPGGLIAQWVPVYNLTPEETRGVVRSFVEAFPDAALWYNATNWLLIGGPDPFAVDPEGIRRRLADPRVSRDLAVSYLGDRSATLADVEGVLAGFLLGPQGLARFAGGAPLYTDDRPILEFSWVRFPAWGPERADLLVLANVEAIAGRLEEVTPYLTVPLDPATFEKVRALRDRYVGHLAAVGYDNLATRAAAVGRIADAFRWYAEAIRAQPDFAQAHYNLGNLHLRLRRFEEAIPHFTEATRLDRSLAEARYALGLALQSLGRYPEALERHRQVIALRPDFDLPYLEAARLQHHLGDAEGAAATLRALLQRRPDHPQAREFLRKFAGG
ncbi:MAG: fused MFS/spermidine synthase, partial [Planctomycetes bacterium]|nr:fused MFS/spermidine synthase [Planctomycetota bacterium]